ncbi:MAG: hypothetical protein CMH94_05680 [Oceanicaulis sp.]|nr:hypothetical protein [Oceanicaulis sp.]MBI75077.1 hypothetical protein [Oceanicaulis sp.]|tara:strand:- start:628 stop:1044 length:417 start_codon:yes stop_codon:yes gene_type:complete
MFQSIMTPVLALAAWTLVMLLWMYATRLPAMQKAGIDATKIQDPAELNTLPIEVRRIAHNYNHLHEQPLIFYVLCIYGHLAGVADELNIMLAWGYVVLRILHSLIQALWNFVPVRFAVFMASSIVLVVMTVRNVIAAM